LWGDGHRRAAAIEGGEEAFDDGLRLPPLVVYAE
jgi:hypothetical protein